MKRKSRKTRGGTEKKLRQTRDGAKKLRNAGVKFGAGVGRLRLLTIDELDGRTRARQITESICAKLIAERGGEDHIDLRRLKHCQTFALLCALVEHEATNFLLGKPVDIATLSKLVNSRRREGEVIGEPTPRDVTDLASYLRTNYPQAPADDAEDAEVVEDGS
jgi:hypothetical protein